MENIQEGISDDEIKQRFTELKKELGKKLDYKVDELCEIYQELLKNGYSINGFIGVGAEGPVFAANNNGSQIAIKILSGDDVSKIEDELKITKKFRNQPYIHQFLNDFYSEDGKYFFQISEKLTCDLEHIMKQKDSHFSYNQIIAFAIQMATALSILEKASVIHSDLKPANILYDKQNKCFKISDYGFSKIILQKSMQERSATQSFKGCTLSYTAPEIHEQRRDYTCKVDIYSLGLILLGLIQGSELNSFELIQIIGGSANFSKYLKDDKQYTSLNKIIQSMLIVDRNDRISASSLLQELKTLQNKEETTLNRYLQARVDDLTLENFKQLYSSTFSQINIYQIQDTIRKIQWEESSVVTENNQSLKKGSFTRSRYLFNTQSLPSNQLTSNIKQQNNLIQVQQFQFQKTSQQQDNLLIKPQNKLILSNPQPIRPKFGLQKKQLQQQPQQLINQEIIQTVMKQRKQVKFKKEIDTIKMFTEAEKELAKYKNDVNVNLEVELKFVGRYINEDDEEEKRITIQQGFSGFSSRLASSLKDCSQSISVLSLSLWSLYLSPEEMENIQQSIRMMSQNLTTLELHFNHEMNSLESSSLAVTIDKCSSKLEVVGLHFEQIDDFSIGSEEIRKISQSLQKCEKMVTLAIKITEPPEGVGEWCEENDDSQEGNKVDCDRDDNNKISDNIGLYNISYIASSLSECKCLTELSLFLYFDIQNEGLQCLGLGLEQCEKLARLNIWIHGIVIYDRTIQEEFGQSLARCPNLSSLSVSCKKLVKKSYKITSFAWIISQKLSLCTKLTRLTLFFYEADEQNIQTIQTNLRQCQNIASLQLVIYDWKFDNVILLIETLEKSNLTSLTIIIDNFELKILGDQKQQANRVVESLSRFQKLTNLFLYFFVFSEGEITQLITNILSCMPTNITTLSLAIEGRDYEKRILDPKEMGECLEKCKHLKALNLCLWRSRMKSQGALQISNRLQKCTNLTTLELSIIEGCCNNYEHQHVYEIDSVAPIIKNNLQKCKNLQQLKVKVRSSNDYNFSQKIIIKSGICTKFESHFQPYLF